MSKYSDFLKNQKQKSIKFYASIYEGLDFKQASNKYFEINRRVNNDLTKILVNVDACHLFQTCYGYGLIVGHDKVVWLKSWQVFKVSDWFQTFMTKNSYQVLLNKDYYIVNQSTKEFDGIVVGICASDSDFEKQNGYLSWGDMVNIAKMQEAYITNNPIKFKI